MKLAVRQYILPFGFAIWLWAFLFARIPLAAIQHLVGLDSRPFVLINLISVGLAVLMIFDQGFSSLRILKNRWLLIGAASLAAFWIMYLSRLLIDSLIVPVEFYESPFALIKSFVNTTLIPIVCLPFILAVRPNRYSLDLCVGLGTLSVFLGEIVYITRQGADRIFYTRFGFEDLNAIPAGHSSASLVILGVLILFLGRHYLHESEAALGRLNAVLALFIGLWGIQLSQTRSAYLSLIPVIIYCLYALWLLYREFGWLFAGGLTLLAVLCVPKIDGLLRRGIPSDPSVSGRLIRFNESFQLIAQHPFLGSGFQYQGLLKALPEPASNWYPHNLFLETYLTGGILLLLLLFVFLFVVFKTGLICFQSHHLQGYDGLILPAIVFLWVQAFVHALFSGHLALIPGFWVGGVVVIIFGTKKLHAQNA